VLLELLAVVGGDDHQRMFQHAAFLEPRKRRRSSASMSATSPSRGSENARSSSVIALVSRSSFLLIARASSP